MMNSSPRSDMKISSKEVENLFFAQLRDWELAGNNYSGLGEVMIRTVVMESGCRINIQFNPPRIRSSAARVDTKSISERPCFLCSGNLPPEQKGLDFRGKYSILVNPFPIFKRHLTIPLNDHEPQLIRGRFADMLNLAEALPGYTIFYNGPHCGASAPDHFHFQAGNKGFLPVEDEFHSFPPRVVAKHGGCKIMTMDEYKRHTIVLAGNNVEDLDEAFTGIYDILHKMQDHEDEPMMNILASHEHDGWRVFIFPRKAHRPAQYFKSGREQVLISPASVDFGGVWITPREKEYSGLDAELINDIFSQVTLGRKEWETLLVKLAAGQND